MTVIADAKKRVTLPKPFKAGDAFELVLEGNRVLLVKLKRPAPSRPAKVVITSRKGTHPVATAERPVSTELVKQLLEEIP